MTVELIVQPFHESFPPNIFHRFGKIDPFFSICYRVSRAALESLLLEVPGNTYAVIVSQAVIDTLKGQHPRMTEIDWINVKFLATAINRQTLVERANAEITNLEFSVRDCSPSLLPLSSNQWRLKLNPKSSAEESEIIPFIERYKESLTDVDLPLRHTKNVLFAVIQYCKNVETLKINGNYLERRAFHNLNSLTKLTELQIHFCPFAPDFTGMSQLLTLEFWNDADHEVTLDLSPLTNLRNLSISSGKITTNVAHLTRLQTLKVYAKNCPDDLTSFTDLTDLDIVLENRPLPGLNASAFVSLTLTESDITDLNFLADFVNLTTLKIRYCRYLEDVSILSQLTNLTSLSLEYCISLDEIPDLSGNTKLQLLELTRLYCLSQIPNVPPNANVKRNQMNRAAIPPRLQLTDEKEFTKVNDPNYTKFEITTVSPYKRIHLENLPNFSRFRCYFPMVTREIYVKSLGRCNLLDFSDLQETTQISVIDSPLVEKIAFNIKDLTHLQLGNLPLLNELSIKEFSHLTTMQLPPFVTREENDVLRIQPVDLVSKNNFLATLTAEIFRYKKVKEMVDHRNWELFFSLMNSHEYLDCIQIMYLHFLPFVNSISSTKAEKLPLKVKFFFLPRLSPVGVKNAVDQASEITLDSWRREVLKFEGNYVTVKDKLLSITPATMQFINAIPSRTFMALYLQSPVLIGPFIPLMNQHQLRVTIPMMSLEQFKQLVTSQPTMQSKYLAHATREQKEEIQK